MPPDSGPAQLQEKAPRTLPAEDVEHMKVDGMITATCEFCSTSAIM
jgi:redox-regulated HSP33 family molecular chaperone